MMSVLGAFQWISHNRACSAIIPQNQLEFWKQKAKQALSEQSKDLNLQANIFGPRSFVVKSLKKA